MKCGGVVLEGVVVTAYDESGSYSDIEGGSGKEIVEDCSERYSGTQSGTMVESRRRSSRDSQLKI